MKPKVSVVVPVYNTGNYLRECLESLINQSLKDIEIICIDDASMDQSYEILRDYASRDKRITLLRNDRNIGVGESRNRGIRCARGDCIYFMDSDDILINDALEKLYNKLKEEQLDICYFKAHVFYDMDLSECYPYAKEGIINFYEGIYTGPELLTAFLNNGDFFYYPWLAIYSKDFINDHALEFSHLKIGEGGLFSICAIIRAKRVAVINEKLYHYRIRKYSATTASDAEINIAIGHFVQYTEVLKILAKESCSVLTRPLKKYLDRQASKIQCSLRNNPTLVGEIEKNLKSDYTRHVFSELCMSRKAYFSDFDSEQKEIVLRARKIIIFGTGLASLDVLSALNVLDMEIIGFAVTRKPTRKVSLYGHHIYAIDELIEYSKKALVIVAANSCYHAEIEETLKRLGFSKYLFLDIRI